ncbi:MAG: hypothetical protein KIT14_20310 [bacterium]|nr:hypothetical protein [bacterium]
MADDPLALLRDAGAACAEAAIRHAVIGAVARNAWATPRATADLDLAAIVPDRAACDRLVAALAARGIAVRRTAGDAADDVPDLLRLERPTGIVRRLDILPAKTPFEVEAVTLAVLADLGCSARVVTPEHLIVYKLIAGRPHDLEDIVEVIRTRELDGRPIDEGLVRRWATEWDIVERLEDVLGRDRA